MTWHPGMGLNPINPQDREDLLSRDFSGHVHLPEIDELMAQQDAEYERKAAMTTITYEWDRADGCTVTIEIGYSYSPVIPASMSGPEEGGLALESISAKKIVWCDEDGNRLRRWATVMELLEAEQAFPDSLAWELASADYTRREDEAQEQRADDYRARHGGVAGESL